MLIHTPKMLATLVRSTRKVKKISQQALSRKSYLRQSTISEFERHPETTKLDTLFRILADIGLELVVQPKGESAKGWTEEW